MAIKIPIIEVLRNGEIKGRGEFEFSHIPATGDQIVIPSGMGDLDIMRNSRSLVNVVCSACGCKSTIDDAPRKWLLSVALLFAAAAIGLPFHSLYWLYVSVPAGLVSLNSISLLIRPASRCAACGCSSRVRRAKKDQEKG